MSLSSSDTDTDEDLQTMIHSARLAVSNAPWSFDAHERLIQALRSAGDIDELNKAREIMSMQFPLPDTMWIEWAEDMAAMAMNENDIMAALLLFQRGTEDYNTMNIWLAYAECAINNLADQRHNVTNILECAVHAVGSHFVLGNKIWKLYRNFMKDDIKYVNELYQRELVFPMKNMEEVYDEYKLYINENKLKSLSSSFERSYAQAKKAMNTRLTIESEIEKASKESSPLGMGSTQLLSLWKSYLSSESITLGKDRSSFVVSLFERSISILFLRPEIWRQYLEYILAMEPIEDNVFVGMCMSIAKRATRNCPNTVYFWILLLRLQYSFDNNIEQSELDARVSLTLLSPNDGAEIYLVMTELYLQELRKCMDANRKIDLKLRISESLKYSEQYVSNNTTNTLSSIDKIVDLYLFWAHIELVLNSDPLEIRSIYEKCIIINSKDASIWKQYISFETKYLPQNIDALRNVYERALEQLKDEKIKRELYSQVELLERVHGSSQMVLTLQYSHKTKLITSFASSSSSKSSLGKGKKRKLEEKKEFNDDVTVKKSKITTTTTTTSAATEVDNTNKKNHNDMNDDDDESNNNNKNTKKNENNDNTTNENNNNNTNENNNNNKQESTTTTTNHKSIPDHTIFVLNISPDTNQSSLEEHFQSCGKIIDIRIPFNGQKKTNRGFAYIEYDDKKSAEKAVKEMHQSTLDKRMLRVSFDQSKTKDYNINYTVFVKKLPVNIDNIEVCLKKTFPKVKDIRLAYTHTGSLKSFCYIEFENKVDTDSALLVTDLICIGNTQNNNEIHKIQVVPYGSKEPTKNNKLMLKPRSLHKSKKVDAHIKHKKTRLAFNNTTEDNNKKNDNQNDMIVDHPPAKKMTNESFRAMLFGKK